MSFELSILLAGACAVLTVLFLATITFFLMLVFHGYNKIVKSDATNTVPAMIGVGAFSIGFIWLTFIGLRTIWYSWFWLSVFHH